jgi:hypothetical protein
MVRRGRLRSRRLHLVSVLALSAALFTFAGPSSAQVTEVTGSAFGARGSVSLFRGAPIEFAPIPTVTLPAAGGNVSDSVPQIVFQAGPAQPLSTDEATVSSEGTIGAGGSVTSTATLANVVVGGTTVTTLSATCTADESGATGSTTVTGGRVPTGDVDRNTEGDETYTDVPANPAANFSLNGLVPSVGTDYYRVVFNEQVVTGNTLTVRAAHFYLGENPAPIEQGGPVATGEIIVGEVTCGATGGGGPAPTTTTVVDGVTTTTTGAVTTTTAGPGVTPTTAGPGVTTPVCPPACPTTTVCPTACPTTVTPLVRTGSQSDLTIAWAALALTLGGLLLLGLRGVPGAAADGHPRSRRDDGMP